MPPVRFAVNRSQLSRERLDYVIAAAKALYEDRKNIPHMRILWGHNLPMRHFHTFLKPYIKTNDPIPLMRSSYDCQSRQPTTGLPALL